LNERIVGCGLEIGARCTDGDHPSLGIYPLEGGGTGKANRLGAGRRIGMPGSGNFPGQPKQKGSATPVHDFEQQRRARDELAEA
jgi:hypothetical protein